ncbi:unnamed protein product, partial [Adineta steineri]
VGEGDGEGEGEDGLTTLPGDMGPGSAAVVGDAPGGASGVPANEADGVGVEADADMEGMAGTGVEGCTCTAPRTADGNAEVHGNTTHVLTGASDGKAG